MKTHHWPEGHTYAIFHKMFLYDYEDSFFRNGSRIPAIVFCLFLQISTANIGAQTLNFCGIPASHEASATSPDSIIYDRFGNTYDRYITGAEYGTSAMSRQLAGYFDLRFNLSAVAVDLRPVIISVFEYISNTIDQRTNTTGCSDEIEPDLVRVYVTTDASLSSSVLATGSPMYYSGFSVPCDEVAANLVDLKINGGLHSGSPDGIINVNPSELIDWYTGSGTPGTGQVDAFSVFLHEALHVIGFASLIGSDGSANGSYYSVWDQFLRTTTNYVPGGISADIEGLLVCDCGVNCWELNSENFEKTEDFTEDVGKNCDGGPFVFVFGDNAIAPLQGGSGNIGNAFSHLNEGCNSKMSTM